MKITFLGHAGFLVETEHAIVVMDPWLSPDGAFDSAWFQFPRNHHLAAVVQATLASTSKECFLYLSHEHKDHFDLEFLRSLSSRNFTLILPEFRREELTRVLADYACRGRVLFSDGMTLAIPGGDITVYLDDSEMDRDSAILLRADGQSFLNINDCKIHDRLRGIKESKGNIDIFTAQFSGAVWHPTCYDYPKKVYEAISMRKRMSKFEAVARAIELLAPHTYLTSAGPACFLDPELFHLNFERLNIFPRAEIFLSYLQKRLKSSETNCIEPMPGDRFDAASRRWEYQSGERVHEGNVKAVLDEYQALYLPFFAERKNVQVDVSQVRSRLAGVLKSKLALLTLADRVRIPLYFGFTEDTNCWLRVDFERRIVEDVTAAPVDEPSYRIAASAIEVERILDGKLSWEDFTLTFRMRLSRNPDVYHIVIHGFLMMEPEDMNWFCKRVLAAESRQERMLVEVQGRRCSSHRYCPHQGADLQEGWVVDDRYLVCPRHRWKFDLNNEGKCTDNDTSIHAFFIEDN